MVGDEREHVVFDMVVHVPVKKPVHKMSSESPAVEPVIEDILSKPGVLSEPVDQHQPGAEEMRQADVEEGKEASGEERNRNYRNIDPEMNPGGQKNPAIFGLGNEGLFGFPESPCGVKEEAAEVIGVGLQCEE